ncbi:three component ABC system middle component [Rhodopirellula halodulae]|uniref:three component ABC system middle component n=1 Tax=Rhodopirellula halodulae TaxID=2894198 RepID=UPI001E304880|nr:three component ABC system middle component [Rhodopirellula sp. JC737]MCC9658304.1 DUF6521 family protein [Rhodopirellula sp. JC737]
MFFEDRLAEFKLVQNEVFGATILWNAVSECFQSQKKVRGMPLPLCMLVLPICYHLKTAESISKCQLSSGIYMALSKDPTIPAGLQDRMIDMADQTFEAIRVGANVGLISLDRTTTSIDLVPKRKTKPGEFKFDLDQTKNIERTAKRLGRWFGELPLPTICSLLRVGF